MRPNLPARVTAMLKILVLWLGCAATALAAAPVPLTLTPAPPVATSGAGGTEAASPPPRSAGWASSPTGFSFLRPSLPDLPGTRLVLQTKPSQCPERFQWCDQGASGPLAPVQSLGAGVGVDLGGGIHLEYARGLVNHFNFLGLGTSFSP